MNSKVKIIKHRDQKPKERELNEVELPSRESTREITLTIKMWVSEFKERRRADEQHSRSVHKLISTAS
jgi:hypothetical protein